MASCRFWTWSCRPLLAVAQLKSSVHAADAGSDVNKVGTPSKRPVLLQAISHSAYLLQMDDHFTQPNALLSGSCNVKTSTSAVLKRSMLLRTVPAP